MTSSPGGSGASVSASPEPSQKPPTAAEDRKRKGREGDDSECHSEVSIIFVFLFPHVVASSIVRRVHHNCLDPVFGAC